MKTQLIGNRYCLEEKIGSGAVGDVFRASDNETGRTTAVKALKAEILERDADLLERFRREGEALRRLNHPNIVTLLDIVEEDGRAYLVLEYVPGGDLAGLIKDSPDGLAIEQLLSIALDLADALTRAHRLAIIHRDLKPANVLLAADGSPRLTDFGFARLVGAESLTASEALIGTLYYLSPEACQGRTLDARADIWSFGVMLFEMLYGQRPFNGEAPWQVLTAIMQEPVPDLSAARPDAPEALVDLSLRMLVKDRDGRIPSVRLVGAELEAIIQGGQLLPEREPVALFQVEGPAPEESALPVPVTPFIGREADVSAVEERLSAAECRLLTLHGPGGIGKTRLALEFARRRHDQYAGGAYFVSLAPLTSPKHIVPAVAGAVGLRLESGSEPGEQLLDHLKERRALLVLDNFEHLRRGAGLVTDIVEAAPGVDVLVTSRERLGLAAECVYEVAGLDAPAEDASQEEMAENDAVRMFTTYARRAQPNYELVGEERTAVAGLCRLVGGMPLAIELAAAWVRVLSAAEILAELEGDLGILENRDPGVSFRQRSAQASFDYSWRMLSEAERTALMKLSVFRGGFDRQAVEVVAGAGIRVLAGLVDKSVLRREPVSGRYQIHELLRQLTGERLEKSGLAAATAKAHAEHYLGLIEDAKEQGVDDPYGAAFHRLIDRELDNIFVALQRSLAAEEGVVALSLALPLANVGQFTWREQARSIEQGLDAAGESVPEALRAEAYLELAHIMLQNASYIQGIEHWAEMIKEARALYIAIGDDWGAANALSSLAFAYFGNDYEKSAGYYRQAVAEFEKLGQEPVHTLRVLGMLEMLEGNLRKAREAFERAMAINRKHGDERGVMRSKTQLAEVAYYDGQPARARALAGEVLLFESKQEQPLGIMGRFIAQGTLLNIALDEGDTEEARRLIGERLGQIKEGEKYGLGMFFFHQVARWLHLLGRDRKAAIWLGCFNFIRDRETQPLERVFRPGYDRLVTAVREALGEEAYAAAYQEGYGTAPEEMVEWGLRLVA